jgi:hypothetical protein
MCLGTHADDIGGTASASHKGSIDHGLGGESVYGILSNLDRLELGRKFL